MCGLLAYAGDATQFEKFAKKFDDLRHRGPDDTEIVKIENGKATFGFHRLAIMDPTQKGHQPFQDAQTGNVIMCNGEVYNYENPSASISHASGRQTRATMIEGLRLAFGYVYFPVEQMNWHDPSAPSTPRRIIIGSRSPLHFQGLIEAK